MLRLAAVLSATFKVIGLPPKSISGIIDDGASAERSVPGNVATYHFDSADFGSVSPVIDDEVSIGGDRFVVVEVDRSSVGFYRIAVRIS